YFPDSRQYISTGLGYSMVRTEAKDNSFDKTAFRAGWMYEWNGGISTLLQAAYGYKSYRAGDFWRIKQINHEYSTSVTVWHRDIYFFWITPKITWNYQRIDSNHPFHDTERNRLFLSFSKYF
ncbi:TPA: surface lipoprotein assembly modifier, partial [Salmonella enterica subsp. enterica serovar Muenchen]